MVDGNRIVVVTGASGGLGRFVTQAFLDTGAHVIGIGRHSPGPSGSNERLLSISADLDGAAAAENAVGEVLSRFEKIDVLAHLVGGFEGGQSIIETEEATLNRMLDLNLRSAFRIVRLVAPHMRTRRSGRIIAVASRTAVDPQPLLGAYGSSKAALVALMRTLALELKSYGVTVNVVLPGTMDTPANRAAMPSADPGAWVHPAQVAKVILWLASDGAGQITGANIPIYGTQ